MPADPASPPQPRLGRSGRPRQENSKLEFQALPGRLESRRPPGSSDAHHISAILPSALTLDTIASHQNFQNFPVHYNSPAASHCSPPHSRGLQNVFQSIVGHFPIYCLAPHVSRNPFTRNYSQFLLLPVQAA